MMSHLPRRSIASGSWHIQHERLPCGRGLRCLVECGGRSATYQEALSGWLDDANFRALFSATLAESPFMAFRWETPAVTATTLTRLFESVLSSTLSREPEPHAFAKHFKTAGDAEVVVFPNLGRDAVMVVPCPVAADSAYGHLAAFHERLPPTRLSTHRIQ